MKNSISHPRLSHFTKVVERLLIYASIASLLVAEALSTFITPVRNLLDSGGSLVLIATVLLSIFRFLDERLPEVEAGFKVADTFDSAISHTLGDSKDIEKLQILAYTSIKYGENIENILLSRNIKVHTLQLIVTHDETTIQKVGGGELSAAIRSWRDRVVTGLVKKVEVRRAKFDPHIHLMIVDEKSATFGFFRSALSPFHARQPMNSVYVFTSSSAYERRFVEDATRFFETIFTDEYSTIVEKMATNDYGRDAGIHSLERRNP